ncbi:hypothetical protein HZA40_02285 [Candidatus Peregrinibacteria bacterium]|nr:hypothetical protein [Candidatus Peregrinibacteria bacterium]
MKDPIFIIFGAITVAFIVLLFLKVISKSKLCVLCASIGLTWISLLILFWLNLFNNPLLIALLIGNSVVGVYYLVEKKTPERLHIFRLPFFLTLLFMGYFLVSTSTIGEFIPTLGLLALLWLIFGFLYSYSHNSKLKSAVSYVINCCKNW